MSNKLENYIVFRLSKPILSIADELAVKLNLSEEDGERVKQLIKEWTSKNVISYTDYWPGA